MKRRKLGLTVFLAFCALLVMLILGFYLNPSTRWIFTFLPVFLGSQDNLAESLEKSLQALESPDYLQGKLDDENGQPPGDKAGQQETDAATPEFPWWQSRATSGSSAGSPSGDTPTPAQTQKAIEKYYLAQLETTARNYEKRLNNLLAQGYNEYTGYQKQGQKVPVASLARKYISAGGALEAECDASFYAILNKFRADLNLYSLPTGIVDQAKGEYEKAKINRKRQLLSKATQL